MPHTPTIYIVCSDHPNNGKTLLARLLVDFLLVQERDPFCFDLSHPQGALRAFFPGRTALIDLTAEDGRRKLFDILLARAGRDYVIDVPGAHLARFCEAAVEAGLAAAAHAKGFRLCVMFIVDRDPASLQTAVAVEDMLEPDLLVPVVNRFAGSCLPDAVPGPVITIDRIESDLQAVVANRRYSLRAFLVGEEEPVPVRLRPRLRLFLDSIGRELRQLQQEPLAVE